MADYTIDVKANVNVSGLKKEIQKTINESVINVKPVFSVDNKSKSFQNLERDLANHFNQNPISVTIKAPSDESVAKVASDINENLSKRLKIDIGFDEKKFTDFTKKGSEIRTYIDDLKKAVSPVKVSFNADTQTFVDLKTILAGLQKDVAISPKISEESKKTFLNQIEEIEKKIKSIQKISISTQFNESEIKKLEDFFHDLEGALKNFDDAIDIVFAPPNDDNLSAVKTKIDEYFKKNPITLTISKKTDGLDLSDFKKSLDNFYKQQNKAFEDFLNEEKTKQKIALQEQLNQTKLQLEEERQAKKVSLEQESLEVLKKYNELQAQRKNDLIDAQQYYEELKNLANDNHNQEVLLKTNNANELKRINKELADYESALIRETAENWKRDVDSAFEALQSSGNFKKFQKELENLKNQGLQLNISEAQQYYDEVLKKGTDYITDLKEQNKQIGTIKGQMTKLFNDVQSGKKTFDDWINKEKEWEQSGLLNVERIREFYDNYMSVIHQQMDVQTIADYKNEIQQLFDEFEAGKKTVDDWNNLFDSLQNNGAFNFDEVKDFYNQLATEVIEIETKRIQEEQRLSDEEKRIKLEAIKAIQVEYQQYLSDKRAFEEQQINESLQKEQEASEQKKSLLQGETEVAKDAITEKTKSLQEYAEYLKQENQNLAENISITEEAEKKTADLAEQKKQQIQDITQAEENYKSVLFELEYLYKTQAISFEEYAKAVQDVINKAFIDDLVPVEKIQKTQLELEKLQKDYYDKQEKQRNDAIKKNQQAWQKNADEEKKLVKEKNDYITKQNQELYKKQEEQWNQEISKLQDRYNKGLISTKTYISEMEKLISDGFQNGYKNVDKYSNSLEQAKKKQDEAGESASNLNGRFDNLFNVLMRYFGVTQIFSSVQNSFRNMVKEVQDLDVELTEFSKVTDLSAQETNVFIDKCYELGNVVARTGTEVVQATTMFKKMGYTVSESMDLAKDALMWTNVADGMVTADGAATMLISTMKAFEEQGISSTHVIDALNEVSNNYSTSSSALSENLSTVAATLAVSGTSFEQTIGLMTAGIEIMPDKASKVANGLKTISQRIRQIGGDTADKLDEFLGEHGLSRFDKVTGELKGTYEILEEISGIWDTLTINQRQYIGEVMAGKNQITVLNALMMNFSTAINATETAMNSAGSAARENERVLDSIQGHIQRFQSAFEELSKNLINSEVFKQVVDFGTNLIKILVNLTDESWKVITILSGASIVTILNGWNKIGNAFQQAQNQAKKLNETLEYTNRIDYFSGTISGLSAVTAAVGIATAAFIAMYQYCENKEREREKRFQENIDTRNKEIDVLKQLKNLEAEYLETKDAEKKKQLYEQIYDKRKEVYQLDKDGLSLNTILSGEIGTQNNLYDEQLATLSLINLQLLQQKNYIEDNKHSWLFLNNLPGSGKKTPAMLGGQETQDQYLMGMSYEDFLNNTDVSVQDKIDNLKQLQIQIAESMKLLKPGEQSYEYLTEAYNRVNEDLDTLNKRNNEIAVSASNVANSIFSNIDLSQYTDEQLGKLTEIFDEISKNAAGDLSDYFSEIASILGQDVDDNFIKEITDYLQNPDVAQACEEFIEKLLSMKKEASNSASEMTYSYSEAMGELLSIFSNTTTQLQQQYDILSQAIDEFNQSGVITKETLQSLTENDLLQYLDMVDGQLAINTEAFRKNEEAIIDNAAAEIDNKLEADLLKLANEKLKESLDNIPSGTNSAGEGVANLTNTVTQATVALINDATAAMATKESYETLSKAIGKEINSSNFDLQGYLNQAQTLINNANALKDKLGNYNYVANRGSSSSRSSSGSSGSSGSSSSSSSRSSGKSDAERAAENAAKASQQAAKNAKEAWKDAFEVEYKVLKTYLDAELISSEEYYDALEALNKKYFEDRVGYEEEFLKYQDEIIKGKQKLIDKAFSRGEAYLEHQLAMERLTQEQYLDLLEQLYTAYYKDREELEEHLWEIEEKRYKLEQEKLETTISYAITILDEEIDKLKEKKEALEANNEELEEQIKLQELQDNLEKAKNTKIRVYKKGEGFVYEQDLTAISTAQTALDKYKQEIDHKKRLSNIDEEIKKLEDYKKKWKDITDNYKKCQDEMTAQSVLGENAREQILNMEYDAVTKVGNRYYAAKNLLSTNNKQLLNNFETYIGSENKEGSIIYIIKNLRDEIDALQSKTVKVVVNIERNETCPSNSSGCPSNSSGCPSNSSGCPSNSSGCPSNSSGCPSNSSGGSFSIGDKVLITKAYQDANKDRLAYLDSTFWIVGIDWKGDWQISKDGPNGEVTHAVPASALYKYGEPDPTIDNNTCPSKNSNCSSNCSSDCPTHYCPSDCPSFCVSKCPYDSNCPEVCIYDCNSDDEPDCPRNVNCPRDVYCPNDDDCYGDGEYCSGDHPNCTSDCSDSVCHDDEDCPGVYDYCGSDNYCTECPTNRSDNGICPHDNEIPCPYLNNASGTLGTITKTFKINEEGLEAMVTPDGTVISAPSLGYGVIKNEYTQRLTDFASDPLQFLNGIFNGYSGNSQNNQSNNETININGNLTLPNVTDGLSFVNSIKTLALQYTTRRR